jgi:hypothetical protein
MSLYRDDQPRQPGMMLYVLQAVGIGGWVFGWFLLIGSYFLPETRAAARWCLSADRHQCGHRQRGALAVGPLKGMAVP